MILFLLLYILFIRFVSLHFYLSFLLAILFFRSCFSLLILFYILFFRFIALHLVHLCSCITCWLFLSCFPFCLLFLLLYILLLYILIFLFVALFFISILISEWWMLLRTLTPPQINYQKSVKYQNWELNSHQLQNKLLMVWIIL